MKTKVGTVTNEQRDQIRALFERNNGLQELSKILTADNTELYERLVTDLGKTSTAMQDWWNDMSATYGWESTDNGSWEIDFNDCSIYLID